MFQRLEREFRSKSRQQSDCASVDLISELTPPLTLGNNPSTHNAQPAVLYVNVDLDSFLVELLNDALLPATHDDSASSSAAMSIEALLACRHSQAISQPISRILEAIARNSVGLAASVPQCPSIPSPHIPSARPVFASHRRDNRSQTPAVVGEQSKPTTSKGLTQANVAAASSSSAFCGVVISVFTAVGTDLTTPEREKGSSESGGDCLHPSPLSLASSVLLLRAVREGIALAHQRSQQLLIRAQSLRFISVTAAHPSSFLHAMRRELWVKDMNPSALAVGDGCNGMTLMATLPQSRRALVGAVLTHSQTVSPQPGGSQRFDARLVVSKNMCLASLLLDFVKRSRRGGEWTRVHCVDGEDWSRKHGDESVSKINDDTLFVVKATKLPESFLFQSPAECIASLLLKGRLFSMLVAEVKDLVETHASDATSALRSDSSSANTQVGMNTTLRFIDKLFADAISKHVAVFPSSSKDFTPNDNNTCHDRTADRIVSWCYAVVVESVRDAATSAAAAGRRRDHPACETMEGAERKSEAAGEVAKTDQICSLILKWSRAKLRMIRAHQSGNETQSAGALLTPVASHHASFSLLHKAQGQLLNLNHQITQMARALRERRDEGRDDDDDDHSSASDASEEGGESTLSSGIVRALQSISIAAHAAPNIHALCDAFQFYCTLMREGVADMIRRKEKRGMGTHQSEGKEANVEKTNGNAIGAAPSSLSVWPNIFRDAVLSAPRNSGRGTADNNTTLSLVMTSSSSSPEGNLITWPFLMLPRQEAWDPNAPAVNALMPHRQLLTERNSHNGKAIRLPAAAAEGPRLLPISLNLCIWLGTSEALDRDAIYSHETVSCAKAHAQLSSSSCGGEGRESYAALFRPMRWALMQYLFDGKIPFCPLNAVVAVTSPSVSAHSSSATPNATSTKDTTAATTTTIETVLLPVAVEERSVVRFGNSEGSSTAHTHHKQTIVSHHHPHAREADLPSDLRGSVLFSAQTNVSVDFFRVSLLNNKLAYFLRIQKLGNVSALNAPSRGDDCFQISPSLLEAITSFDEPSEEDGETSFSSASSLSRLSPPAMKAALLSLALLHGGHYLHPWEVYCLGACFLVGQLESINDNQEGNGNARVGTAADCSASSSCVTSLSVVWPLLSTDDGNGCASTASVIPPPSPALLRHWSLLTAEAVGHILIVNDATNDKLLVCRGDGNSNKDRRRGDDDSEESDSDGERDSDEKKATTFDAAGRSVIPSLPSKLLSPYASEEEGGAKEDRNFGIHFDPRVDRQIKDANIMMPSSSSASLGVYRESVATRWKTCAAASTTLSVAAFLTVGGKGPGMIVSPPLIRLLDHLLSLICSTVEVK